MTHACEQMSFGIDITRRRLWQKGLPLPSAFFASVGCT
jgi:hypothetical protein